MALKKQQQWNEEVRRNNLLSGLSMYNTNVTDSGTGGSKTKPYSFGRSKYREGGKGK